MVLFSFFFFFFIFFFSWKELSSQVFLTLTWFVLSAFVCSPQILTSHPCVLYAWAHHPCLGTGFAEHLLQTRLPTFLEHSSLSFQAQLESRVPGPASRAPSPLLTILFFLRRVAPNLHGRQLCCPSEVTFIVGLVIFVHKLLESASCHRVTRLQTPGCSKLVFNTSDRLFRCFTQLLSPSPRLFWNALPTESKIL